MTDVGEHPEIKTTSSSPNESSSKVSGTPPTSPFQDCAPIEILTAIFSYLPWNVPTASRAPGKFPSWFAVSHVCRLWRAVALDYPQFWGYLPLESTTWTSVALERSNLGFICIDAGPDVFGEDRLIKREALDLALAEARRATNIAIVMYGYQMARHIFERLKTLDASAMVDLHLVFRRSRLDDTPNFLNTLFSATVPPNLRVLKLLGLAVQPGCPLFTPSLTHLELDKPTAWESLAEMFDVLAGLPNLTHLLLRRGEYGSALPSWESPDPLLNDGVMGRTIVFPRLKLLHISGDTSVAVRALQVLRTPVCAELEIEYFEDWIDVGLEMYGLWALLPLIAQVLSALLCVNAYDSTTVMHPLTRLEVIAHSSVPLWRTVSDMTAFLAHFPCLRVLALDLNNEGYDLPDDLPSPVHLENLSLLRLQSATPTTGALTRVADYISTPSATERVVSVEYSTWPRAYSGPILPILSRLFCLARTEHGGSFTSLDVDEQRDPPAGVSFSMRIIVSKPTVDTLPPRLELNVSLVGSLAVASREPWLVSSFEDLLPQVLIAFPLAAVREVSVSHYLFEEDTMWHKAFDVLATVETLRVRCGSQIACSATRVLVSATNATQDDRLFPALKCLAIEEIDFTRADVTPGAFVQRDPPYSMHLSRCCIDEGALNALRQALGEDRLSWDGFFDASGRAKDVSWRYKLARLPLPWCEDSVDVLEGTSDN